MNTAYHDAVEASKPTPMEAAIARIAAGSMTTDRRASETALQRFWRRITERRSWIA